jgi:septal ring factor EnvC (AmiA/AmiB activator)
MPVPDRSVDEDNRDINRPKDGMSSRDRGKMAKYREIVSLALALSAGMGANQIWGIWQESLQNKNQIERVSLESNHTLTMELVKQVNSLATSLASVNQEKDTLKFDLREAQTQIENLKKSLASLTTERQELVTKVAEQSQKIKELEARSGT